MATNKVVENHENAANVELFYKEQQRRRGFIFLKTVNNQLNKIVIKMAIEIFT